MIIVDTPSRPPGICVASGKGESAEGFVDFGPITGVDPQVYVAVTVLRDLAPKLGLVLASEHQRVVTELDETRQRLADALRDLAEYEQYKESVEWTLRSVGKKVARKPGPAKVAA